MRGQEGGLSAPLQPGDLLQKPFPSQTARPSSRTQELGFWGQDPPETPRRLLGRPAPGRDHQRPWGQGCPGGQGGVRGGGPPGLLEACREGGLSPGPPGAPRSSTGGEGQVTFFAEAGILTSDFPCSAWGRSWQCRAGTAGGAGRAGARRLPGTQSSRPKGSTGPSLTVPGPGLPTLGCLAHPSHRPACDFLIPAGALLSHTGLR